MDPSALSSVPSGLPAAVADVRAFLAGVSFARPGWLALSVVPVLLALLHVRANRLRRTALARFAHPVAVAGLLVGPRRPSRWAGFALALAWPLAVLGAAGPRWGTGDPDGIAVGRDVVVALDLSRSMLADDGTNPPSRWKSAVAGVADLIETVRAKGGHRVGVVVFAAQPVVLVPLTTDADHLRTALAELDAAAPPPGVRPLPDSVSGTRIGAALAAAVAAHDPRFPGSQDVILVSDGDDPAGDREWATGVSGARAANVPVHTVGVGDPDRDSPIPLAGAFLESDVLTGEPERVRTRLREAVLREIATEGRGAYLPARRDVPQLGEFFRTRIEPHPSRELTDDALPQPRDRSAGFLALAAVCLAAGWLGGTDK